MNDPRLYIEEVPSGVRRITGAATSIALFIGWAPRGPTDRAMHIVSFGEFERSYGGLDDRSDLGYALRHFFSNGGTEAYVIRLVDGDAATAGCSLGPISIKADSAGQWANTLQIVAERSEIAADRFRLLVTDTNGVVLEAFEDLSLSATDARYAPEVIGRSSKLLGSISISDSTAAVPDGRAPLCGEMIGMDGTIIGPDAAGAAGVRFCSMLPGLFDAGGIAERIELFNLICVPGLSDRESIMRLLEVAHRRRAFLIVDSPRDATLATIAPYDVLGSATPNGAVYYPWVLAQDPVQGRIRPFPPCGFIAGLYARYDSTRGVWKAAAGVEAGLVDAAGPATSLTDAEIGLLNPLAINCIRRLDAAGTVVWGARTMQGSDAQGSEWKYVPVRRLALFIEESIYRGTQWVAFEPNDEALWAQVRLNVGAFLQSLFREGAFRGTKSSEAYFVRCDESTTTPSDVAQGVVNFTVGFAPIKPAEFVVIKFQLLAGAQH